ncbi:MAG: MoaD/ThiS family protein [SAR202 cluster bacterium]|nr:MoaD/ThiS family protein [SAR202 cluster bacterium]|tara:strand:- start:488 stop:697 length:210 start_codon:yes stop_codon:yes gene_type:complete
MKVIIRNPDRKTLEMSGGLNVETLLKNLDFNPEQVLVIRDNNLLTRDIVIGDGDTVEILRAISGGTNEM